MKEKVSLKQGGSGIREVSDNPGNSLQEGGPPSQEGVKGQVAKEEVGTRMGPIQLPTASGVREATPCSCLRPGLTCYTLTQGASPWHQGSKTGEWP